LFIYLINIINNYNIKRPSGMDEEEWDKGRGRKRR
jgi:hypothetical protein